MDFVYYQRDSRGRTIRDFGFNPFHDIRITADIDYLLPGHFMKITPDNVNIIIEKKIDRVIAYECDDEIIEKILTPGTVKYFCTTTARSYNIKGQYHVDFTNIPQMDGKITSYYSHWYETSKTLYLKDPKSNICNNLFVLESIADREFPHVVLSDYIRCSNYLNIPQVEYKIHIDRPYTSIERKIHIEVNRLHIAQLQREIDLLKFF